MVNITSRDEFHLLWLIVNAVMNIKITFILNIVFQALPKSCMQMKTILSGMNVKAAGSPGKFSLT